MHIDVRAVPFDPYRELSVFEQRQARHGKYGASVSFIGTMRDFNDAAPVAAMTLEHYAGMTEKYLQRIVGEACQRWDVMDVAIVHRVGALNPGDPIVLVAVWSAHRAAAFDACRYLIEELKTRAPFWKKESNGAVERWVEHNTERE
jgi:molybdopterin synthase catalytic subunit